MNNITTIQETSKELKGKILISFLVMFLSIFVTATNNMGSILSLMGMLSFFCGFVYFVIVKFKIWWRHK